MPSSTALFTLILTVLFPVHCRAVVCVCVCVHLAGQRAFTFCLIKIHQFKQCRAVVVRSNCRHSSCNVGSDCSGIFSFSIVRLVCCLSADSLNCNSRSSSSNSSVSMTNSLFFLDCRCYDKRCLRIKPKKREKREKQRKYKLYKVNGDQFFVLQQQRESFDQTERVNNKVSVTNRKKGIKVVSCVCIVCALLRILQNSFNCRKICTMLHWQQS